MTRNPPRRVARNHAGHEDKNSMTTFTIEHRHTGAVLFECPDPSPGAPMSVRDKGPLWIVYPYDQNTDYQSEVVFSRSIWQLNRITIQQ